MEEVASSRRRAALMAVGFAVLYAIYAAIYRGSSHQDAANHYGYAVDGIRSLTLLLDPWGRPLWNFLLCLPAQGGILASRIACAALAGWTLWETYRLARVAAPDAALLAVPALGFQFHFFALAGDNMTEPVFALFFAIALRLWLEKKIVPSLLVASLLPLARPEGFFLGILWGFFVLATDLPLKKRLTYPLLLLTGTLAWFAGGLIADGDPLFIVHHWPPNWTPAPIYGSGRLLHYVQNWPEFTGAALLLPFMAGLVLAWRARRWHLLATFAFFFLLHTLLWWRGLFGSIGYLRYFVCIGPLIAVLTADGLRFLASWLQATARIPARATAALLIAGCAVQTVWMYEAQGLLHVYAAYEDAYAAWAGEKLLDPPPAIVADAHARHVLHARDVWKHSPPTLDAADQIAIYKKLPPGARILWDDQMGGGYYSLKPAQFTGNGFRIRARRTYDLDQFRARWYRWLRGPRPEPIEITLYERE